MTQRFCMKCGAPLNEGVRFCTKCGTSVDGQDAANPLQASPVRQPEKRSKKLAIGIAISVIAVVAILAIVLILVLPSMNGGRDGQPIASSAATQQAQKVSCSWGYLEIDNELQGRISATADSDIMTITTADGQKVVACIQLFGTHMQEDERKQAVYKLGATDGDLSSVVQLRAFYADADGQCPVHWGKAGATELGLQSLCGVTPEQLAAHVQIYNFNTESYSQAVAELSGGDAASTTESQASSSNAQVSHVPFWGVWGLASKDESECIAEVERLKGLGYADAACFLTTDWANLNPEPWYVVTVGKYSSEELAEDLSARINGVRDIGEVYAKYTGEYIGG